MASLSNTATPRYYGEFRDQVMRGIIPVCETISMEMNRIDALIRNPNIYYDPDPVEGWIEFCENELTLTDGSPLNMLPSFKMWGEQVYGWYIFTEKQIYTPYKYKKGGEYRLKRIKRRLTNRQYLIVSRGNAKTLYDECHQAYGLVIDLDATDGIATAPTMDQAEEMLNPLRTAIEISPGPLFKFLTAGSLQNTTGNRNDRKKLASTKKGIQCFLTNSILRIRPMSIDKLQGLRNKYSTVDEWLSCDIRENPITALEQGSKKLDDWLLIASSSEGCIRNGPGDSIKMELMSILKGDFYSPSTSIFWYKQDDIKEISHPELWIKSNPNITITVQYETLQEEVEKAEKIPSERNDIIAKRFCIPMEGFTYFFTYDETLAFKKKFSFWQMPCSLGIDLSQGDDFCAFTFLFPLEKGSFGVKTRSYITERTYYNLHSAMRLKYDEFKLEGTLVVMDDPVLDMMKVYEDIDQHIDECEYEIICLGYDPYNAKEFVGRWERERGLYGIEKVRQGVQTESVPLGEIKKLAEDRLLLFDEKLMEFAMGNAMVLEDTNGNRKLYKKRSSEKIDNVSALMDAYVAYKLHSERFD